jgi:hypothetical protein
LTPIQRIYKIRIGPRLPGFKVSPNLKGQRKREGSKREREREEKRREKRREREEKRERERERERREKSPAVSVGNCRLIFFSVLGTRYSATLGIDA